MNYSIGMGTFDKRFEKYFKPIIKQIKNFRPNLEIIVFVNGPLKEKFNENYRKEILSFCSEHENLFPHFTPQQRGFSKLVNSCLTNESNHNVLLLNDDLTIKSENFFNEFEKILKL